MRSLVGLADLAHIVARLPRDDARELAHALGFEAFDARAQTAPQPPPTDDDRAQTPEATYAAAVATLEAQRAGPSLPPAAFWRVERYEPAPDEGDAASDPATVITDPLPEGKPRGSLFATPQAPPLTPWRHLWPTLQSALRTELPGRDPDVAALVHRWSRGEAVQRIPHVRRRAWASRASLWIDQSPHLIPLWHDQRRVEGGLRRVFRRALEVRWLGREAAQRAATSPRGWLHGRRLDDATPVLVLGDLGALGGDGAPRWQHALREMHARGVRVTAVVPWSTRRHRERAMRCARVVAWERTRGAGRAEDERLLQMASKAAFVEPGLLRALRWLLPDADVESELRAWNDPRVEAADDSVMLLRVDALTALRRDFDALDATLQTQVGAVLRRWREGMLREVTYAETIAWCESGGDPAVAPGDVAEARAFVERLAAMLTAGTAADGSAWMQYGRSVHEGMPAAAYRNVPALARVWEIAHEGIDGAVAPEGVDVAALRARRKGRAAVSQWALRQVGDALVVSGRKDTRWPSEEEGVGSPVAVLEAAGAEVGVDDGAARTQRVLRDGLTVPLRAGARVALRGARGTLHLAACEREPWATAAGRDAFGLWTEVTVAGVAFRMRWVPPGRFVMSSPKGEAGRWDTEGTQHAVLLTQGYWLGETPVTQALWMAVMKKNSSRFRSASRPVERVSWNDCQKFIEKANERVSGLEVGLPTEAEWEHACRAGTTTATWTGDLKIVGENNAPLLDEIAWYGGNSGKDFDLPKGWDSSKWPDKQYPHTKAGTREVGMKAPNPLGLHDMMGNVWEWCADWRGAPDASPEVDPMGPASGTLRVLCGGSWGNNARSVRAAAHLTLAPNASSVDIGFRLARGQSALQRARKRKAPP